MPLMFPTLAQFLKGADLAHQIVLLKPNAPGVTDRALRYRAVRNAPPRSRCYWCGVLKQKNGRALDVAHINGLEEDNDPQNLGWSCRSCNVVCGRVLTAAGLGRATNQYNPGRRRGRSSHGDGAMTMGQWFNAVMSMKGDSRGSMRVADAVALIRATPASRRSSFAKEIWDLRRERGTDSSVPF